MGRFGFPIAAAIAALGAAACGGIGIDYGSLDPASSSAQDLPPAGGGGVKGDGDSSGGGGTQSGGTSGDGDGGAPPDGVVCPDGTPCDEDGFFCSSAGTCQAGNSGDPCTKPEDCGPTAPICSLATETCQAGISGAPCLEDIDCRPAFECRSLSGGGERTCQLQVDSGPGPSASTLVDDFSASNIDLEWVFSAEGMGCTVEKQASHVQFELNGDPGRCAFTTDGVYDLRGESVSIDIPPINSFSPEMSVFLSVVSESGDVIELAFLNGQFVGSALVDGQSVFSNSASYEPTPTHWRIRQEGSSVFLEASTNGSSFVVKMQMSVPFDLSRVHVSFGVEASQALSDGAVGIGVFGVNTL